MSRHLDDVRFHQLTPEEEEEEELSSDTRIRRKNATVIYVDEEEISSRGADGMKSSIQDRLDTEPCPHAPNCSFVRTGSCIYKYHPGQEVTEQLSYTFDKPSTTRRVVKYAKELYLEKFAKAEKRDKFRWVVRKIMAKK